MALKRFDKKDKPEKKPEQAPESVFSPLKSKKDQQKEALGKRVYSKDEQSRYLSTNESATRLQDIMENASVGLEDLGKLMKAYAKALRSPSDENVNEFMGVIEDISNDEERSRTILMVAATNLFHYMNGGK